jgi:hypothetical protein
MAGFFGGAFMGVMLLDRIRLVKTGLAAILLAGDKSSEH